MSEEEKPIRVKKHTLYVSPQVIASFENGRIPWSGVSASPDTGKSIPISLAYQSPEKFATVKESEFLLAVEDIAGCKNFSAQRRFTEKWRKKLFEEQQ